MAENCYAESHYAVTYPFLLSAVLLNVVMLSVVAPAAWVIDDTWIDYLAVDDKIERGVHDDEQVVDGDSVPGPSRKGRSLPVDDIDLEKVENSFFVGATTFSITALAMMTYHQGLNCLS